MPRKPTTADAFNAVAEPRRREILTLLALGERSVNDLAAALKIRQPQASKHLAVLLEVELVRVRVVGRQHFYTLNAEKLKPIHEWVKAFERFWNESFDRLDEYLKELQKEKTDDRTG